MTTPSFGHAFRQQHFQFAEGIAPVNHGLYGSLPRVVMDAYKRHLDAVEAFPDHFMRPKTSQQAQLKAAGRVVAEFIGADPNSVVFDTNALAAANTILRLFPFAKGDVVVTLQVVYGACDKTLQFVASRVGIEVVYVPIAFPLTDDQIVDAFEEVFVKHKPRMAMFDTVVLMPGVRLPYERLVALCRKHDVLSFVDGAHAIGLIPLSIGELKPDFFISNLHKWLFVPRGCAFIYVDKKHHRVIHTSPISHLYLPDDVVLADELEETRLVDRFAFYSTHFYASVAVVDEALKFRKEVCGGEEAIQKYCLELALAAANAAAAKWGTSVLGQQEDGLVPTATAMINVEVPMPAEAITAATANFPAFLDSLLPTHFDTFKTFVPLVPHNGKVYARFLGMVYNELSDYEQAADAVAASVGAYVESLGLESAFKKVALA